MRCTCSRPHRSHIIDTGDKELGKWEGIPEPVVESKLDKVVHQFDQDFTWEQTDAPLSGVEFE